jgi:acyl phosphate:glycerol-3-phosphate acyltransferase
MTWWFLLPLAAYLLGSVSFAWIAGRLNGIDLREHGSRSLGATNAGRVLGRRWFFIVFALDVAKGWVSVFLAQLALVRADGGDPTTLLLLVGAGAILGHVFTCFHRCKGGKAVATSLGVLIALMPQVAGISFLAWLVAWLLQWAVFRRTRSDAVGPASVVAAIAAPLAHILRAADAWRRPELPLTIFILLLSALVVVKHRSNLAKLFARKDVPTPG